MQFWPCLSQRQGFQRYPVHSPVPEVHKDRKLADRMVLNAIFCKFKKNYIWQKKVNTDKDARARLAHFVDTGYFFRIYLII